MDIRFVWDENKNRSNKKKHKISSEEARKLKQQISIRIEKETVNYFKNLSSKTGIPYQNLIDLYLRDCAQSHKKLGLKWA